MPYSIDNNGKYSKNHVAPNTWTYATVAVGATSTKLADTDTTRKTIIFQNMSNEVIYVTAINAATTAGWALGTVGTGLPGGTLTIDMTNGDPTTEFYGICASGSKNVNVSKGI